MRTTLFLNAWRLAVRELRTYEGERIRSMSMSMSMSMSRDVSGREALTGLLGDDYVCRITRIVNARSWL